MVVIWPINSVRNCMSSLLPYIVLIPVGIAIEESYSEQELMLAIFFRREMTVRMRCHKNSLFPNSTGQTFF